MALTDSKIKAAKPKAKPSKLSDSHRLYCYVSKAGTKKWKWNYRLNGERTWTIGDYPSIGLAEARQKRDFGKSLVKQGIHPVAYERDQQLKRQADQATTFWAVTDEWLIEKAQAVVPSTAKQMRGVLERYLRDTDLGARGIRTVTAADMYGLIRRVAKREKPGKGERKKNAYSIAALVKQWCSAIFRLALASGRADQNPADQFRLSDILSRPPINHNRDLNEQEIGEFFERLRQYRGRRQTAIAIELLMLTMVRTGELRQSKWSEFDLDTGTWFIPAERMKVKHRGDHVVPLSARAIMLLRELRQLCPAASDSDYLFPSIKGLSKCMSATTINRALEYMKLNGSGSIGFSAHGFRGTASTLLRELKAAPDPVIEVQLAHAKRDKIEAAYNKAKFLVERRAMMEFWSQYLHGVEKGKSTVVPLKQKSKGVAMVA